MSNLNDFVIENGVLKQYKGSDEHVVVPEGVIELDWHGCFVNENLRSVELPDTVKKVDPRSFPDWGKTLADENGFCRAGKFLVNYVGNAETVVVPEGITELLFRAISGNSTIKKLVLPASIEIIRDQALNGCSQLEEVVFAENSPSFKGIDSLAFLGCRKLAKINIPENTEIVGREVFDQCEKLFDSHGFLVIGSVLAAYKGSDKCITVPAGVKVIADCVFAKSSDIEKVVLPDGVKIIGSEAFWKRKTLKTVEIPDSVTEIGHSAFCWCENLKEISLKGVKKIGNRAFEYCTKLQKVAFSSGLEEIGDSAFYSCRALTEIRLFSGLKKLGNNVQANRNSYSSFEGVFAETGLSSVEIPDGVEQLGCAAFYNCSKLKSIRIPGSVRIIGESAFARCPQLEKPVLEEGLRAIEKEAFCLCGKITNIEVPESVQSIGEHAFFRCGKLENVSIPAHLTGESKEEYLTYLGIGDENGCIIQDGVLVHYVGPSDEVRITDGVTVLSEGVFNVTSRWGRTGSDGSMRIILPDSVKVFHESDFGRLKPEINLPAGYLRQSDKLPAGFTYTLISGIWRDQVTPEDLAALFVFQSGKDLISHCQAQLKKDPERSVQAFMAVLDGSKKGAAYGKAAEFIFSNKDKIKQETIDAFYAFASAAKAKKAVETLGPCVSVQAESAGSKSSTRGKKAAAKAADEHPIEALCRANFAEAILDKTLKKAGVQEKLLASVKYKDSSKKAPAFVVKCAIAPYIAQMESRPKSIGGYRTDYIQTSLDAKADEIAAALDRESLQAVLQKMAKAADCKAPQCFIPYCRFATAEQIKSVISLMNSWSDWDTYSSSGRSAIIVARGALLLNDSREAMLYADKHNCLYHYACASRR